MSPHEIPELDAKGLRNFALTIGGIVGVLFGLVLPWLFEARYPRWPWYVLGVFVVWGLVWPLGLRLVYRGWMRFGLLLNKVTSPIVLGVAFFFVVLPVGLVRRALSRDPMRRGFDAAAESYRVSAEKRPKEQLERPF